MDIKQIINEFRSLESTTHKDNTYNVISLFDMLHKLGASKERYPMFFIATNDAPNNIPNTIRELLSVEYDMECTINEVSGNSILIVICIVYQHITYPYIKNSSTNSNLVDYAI